jgi:hypothetical protein
MTEAPEKIWAHAPTTFDEMDVWQTSETDGAIEYTRTDVTEARIKELEDVLMGYQDEFCEHGGDLCGRLKSGSCKGCRAATALKGENK